MPRKDPIGHLARHHHDDELPLRLAEEIFALGPAAVSALVALVDAPDATVPGSLAERCALHAVWLLPEFEHPDVFPTLVRAFATWPAEGKGALRARIALEQCAHPELVEPLLALEAPDRAIATTMILASCGVVDRRIGARIADLLRIGDLEASYAVANYVRDGDDPIDDPDLLAAVHAAFDRCLVDLREATEAVVASTVGVDAIPPIDTDPLFGPVAAAQLYVTVLERLGETSPTRAEALSRAVSWSSARIRDRMRELEDEVRLLRS